MRQIKWMHDRGVGERGIDRSTWLAFWQRRGGCYQGKQYLGTVSKSTAGPYRWRTYGGASGLSDSLAGAKRSLEGVAIADDPTLCAAFRQPVLAPLPLFKEAK